jgi:GMP synthase-like glutamine amidotransferase
MESVKTPCQGIKVKGQNKFGVQFDPELDSKASDKKNKVNPEKKANGNKLIANFLKLCK